MDNRSVNLSKQRGGVLMFVVAAIGALAMMAVIGSTLYSTLVSGTQRSSLNIGTAQILTQSAATITTEVNTAGSYPVSTAFLAASPAPTGGGQIYTVSAAPKVDAWGTAIGYCTYAAAAQGDPVFAVVSAGPDKTFQTACTQALAGTAAGDDGVRYKNVTSIRQGVGGTVYYGDPVTNVSDLGLLAAPKPGEMRLVKSVALVYVNPTGTAGQANWLINQNLPVVVSAASCTGYTLGSLGKDAAGDVYTCK